MNQAFELKYDINEFHFTFSQRDSLLSRKSNIYKIHSHLLLMKFLILFYSPILMFGP